MKKAFYWCLIMTKRHLKRVSTIVILVCMLLLTIGMKILPSSITASIDIGFCILAEDSDRVTSSLSVGLLKHEGLLNFISYDSVDTLKTDVANSTITCGYVFKEDFSNSLTSGNTRNLVELYTTPENTVSLLADVVILASVMEHGASEMLVADILEQDFFTHLTDEDVESVYDIYNTYATNGSTFSFDYNTLYEDYKGSSDQLDISSFLITPVRGIISIFIFVAALTGGISRFTDDESASYANIRLHKRHLIRLLNVSIPAFLSGIVGFLSVIVLNIGHNIAYEFFAIMTYTVMCILFTYALTYILKKSLYYPIVPVLTLGSVICCPIFFNLGNIIPSMKILEHIFMPTYYLTLFF